MDLKDISVSELADLTASKSPAPGGGAIAAMTGAYGAALAAMVARLTIGKRDSMTSNQIWKTLPVRQMN